LTQKSRKLATRSKFFEALSQFHGGLRADANPREVMEAVAPTAIQTLDVPNCCVITLSPRSSFAETLVADGQTPKDSVFVDAPGNFASVSTTPRVMTAENIDWLLPDISPNLGPRGHADQKGHPRFYWIPLLSDGATIGGVVWAALGDEIQRLGRQEQEIIAIASGWSVALRTSQIREESRGLAENLADVSRRLQTSQAEVTRARMVSSIAEMAAGAAHEMNNPLAVISGWSQRLMQEINDARLNQSARQIHEQADKLSGIITELMDYAKPQPASREKADLLRIIDRAVRGAKTRSQPEARKIETALHDVPNVMVDGLQISGAIQEIIENAIQATDPQTGKITIGIDFDAYSMQVVVTVQDNGVGMDEATLKRAFDPFFSQKPAGRRRGMGLAKALRWIESSGGSVRLESEQGKGARAVILLPSETAAEKKAAPSRRAAT
jgi:signal transduction histidine kinase